MPIARHAAVTALALALAAGCSPAPNGPTDGGGNSDGAAARDDARVIENPGDDIGDPLPDSQDPGAVNGGTDAIGSCSGYQNTLMLGPTGARVCIDYTSGTVDDARAHCAGLGSGGTFNMGVGCNTTASTLVGSCTQASPARTVYFFRQTATRTMPDPPDVTSADVSTWCSANGWTPMMSATPMNTGRCQFRSTTTFMNIESPALSVCINYDSGATAEQAQADCAMQAESRAGMTPSFSAGESCTAGSATLGCRFTTNGATKTWRISWPYRSTAPWTDADFQSNCERAGGMFITGR